MQELIDGVVDFWVCRGNPVCMCICVYVYVCACMWMWMWMWMFTLLLWLKPIGSIWVHLIQQHQNDWKQRGREEAVKLGTITTGKLVLIWGWQILASKQWVPNGSCNCKPLYEQISEPNPGLSPSQNANEGRSRQLEIFFFGFFLTFPKF